MNVEELREALDDLPDNAQVLIVNAENGILAPAEQASYRAIQRSPIEPLLRAVGVDTGRFYREVQGGERGEGMVVLR